LRSLCNCKKKRKSGIEQNKPPADESKNFQNEFLKHSALPVRQPRGKIDLPFHLDATTFQLPTDPLIPMKSLLPRTSKLPRTDASSLRGTTLLAHMRPLPLNIEDNPAHTCRLHHQYHLAISPSLQEDGNPDHLLIKSHQAVELGEAREDIVG
jgi:hypothetical protein